MGEVNEVTYVKDDEQEAVVEAHVGKSEEDLILTKETVEDLEKKALLEDQQEQVKKEEPVGEPVESKTKKKTTRKRKTKASTGEAKKTTTKKVTKQGERTVTASIGTKKDTEKKKHGTESSPLILREKLTAKEFAEGNYSEVGISFGLTLNMGNYESVRFDIHQKDFCKPEDRAEMRRLLCAEVTNYTYKSAVDIKNWLRSKWKEMGY